MIALIATAIAIIVYMKYIFQPHPQSLSLLKRGECLRQQIWGEVPTVYVITLYE